MLFRKRRAEVKRLVEDAKGSVWVMARKSSKDFYEDLGFAEAEPPAAVCPAGC